MSPIPTDERELIRRAAAGDDEAFRLLVGTLLPRLRRWSLALTGDPDDADEAVQRTLIAMHRALSSFRTEARLSTWLYRILTNAARDVTRSGWRRRRVPLDGRGADPAPRLDPAGRIHTRRLADAVLAYTRMLPPRQREVLTLVDHDGMRPADVAEMLGLNPITVRAHLFKARRTVRAAILAKYPDLTEGYPA